MGAFGEKLRKQREERGVALEAISGVTKISPRMLRAIEEEKFDQLPGGVFNKGFVRAYARQIGIDEEEAVNDYLSALRESQIQSQNILPDLRADKSPEAVANKLDTAAHNSDAQDKNAQENAPREIGASKSSRANRSVRRNGKSGDSSGINRQNHNPDGSHAQPAIDAIADAGFGKSTSRLPWGAFATVALLAVCALAWFWSARRHNRSSGVASPEAPSNVATAVLAENPSTSTAPLLDDRHNTQINSSPVKSAKIVSGVTTGSAKATVHSAANETGRTFTLVVRAHKTSWVSITADGKLVAEETLIAPAEESVRASRDVVVKAGNAAGISFRLDAREIPAQGEDGQVRTYSFDASGMKTSPSSQLSSAQ